MLNRREFLGRMFNSKLNSNPDTHREVFSPDNVSRIAQNNSDTDKPPENTLSRRDFLKQIFMGAGYLAMPPLFRKSEALFASPQEESKNAEIKETDLERFKKSIEKYCQLYTDAFWDGRENQLELNKILEQEICSFYNKKASSAQLVVWEAMAGRQLTYQEIIERQCASVCSLVTESTNYFVVPIKLGNDKLVFAAGEKKEDKLRQPDADLSNFALALFSDQDNEAALNKIQEPYREIHLNPSAKAVFAGNSYKHGDEYFSIIRDDANYKNNPAKEIELIADNEMAFVILDRYFKFQNKAADNYDPHQKYVNYDGREYSYDQTAELISNLFNRKKLISQGDYSALRTDLYKTIHYHWQASDEIPGYELIRDFEIKKIADKVGIKIKDKFTEEQAQDINARVSAMSDSELSSFYVGYGVFENDDHRYQFHGDGLFRDLRDLLKSAEETKEQEKKQPLIDLFKDLQSQGIIKFIDDSSFEPVVTGVLGKYKLTCSIHHFPANTERGKITGGSHERPTISYADKDNSDYIIEIIFGGKLEAYRVNRKPIFGMEQKTKEEMFSEKKIIFGKSWQDIYYRDLSKDEVTQIIQDIRKLMAEKK